MKTTILSVTTTAALAFASQASADMLTQAVNTFQNAQATQGAEMTVDAKGPVEITDAVELPKFAFAVYDVDVTDGGLTMTLIAELEKLQITSYDDTTFDRYYFAFDRDVSDAKLSDATDENFVAKVEMLEAGTTVSTAGAFVDGMSAEHTFENGGIMMTIGEGTDLAKILENNGSLSVDF